MTTEEYFPELDRIAAKFGPKAPWLGVRGVLITTLEILNPRDFADRIPTWKRKSAAKTVDAWYQSRVEVI
jgi:hypothetical protein